MQQSTPDEGNGTKGLLRHIHFRSATALVVANVIGAGVFTTTGFQAADLGHPGIILLLWALVSDITRVGWSFGTLRTDIFPPAGGMLELPLYPDRGP